MIVETSYCESQFPDSVGHGIRKMADRNRKKPSPFKWESFPSKSTRVALEDSVGDWENPLMFAAALEKVESWIFSRIIESLWWQVITFFHSFECCSKFLLKKNDVNNENIFNNSFSTG